MTSSIEKDASLGGAELIETSHYVRQRMLRMCLASDWGHVGGCSSAVEILTALYFGGVLQYSQADPEHPGRDRVLVRGHLGPTRYVIFSLLGWVDDGELDGHAQLGSRLQGHETRATPGVDVGPSGSLGMSLSYGVGVALASAARDERWTTYVILGDGEEQEGNVAEAARHAAASDVRRLVVVIDRNGKQLSGPTTEADIGDLAAIWSGYGWNVLHCPAGNDVLEMREQLSRARALSESGPVVLIADTEKGVGLEGAADHFSGLHELGHADPTVVRRSLGPQRDRPAVSVRSLAPAEAPPSTARPWLTLDPDTPWSVEPDGYQLQVLTALADIWSRAEHGQLYFFYADTFPTPLLARTGLATAAVCLNVGIREQHLVAMGHGLALADPGATIILHTGDPFLLRAADQLQAAAHEEGVSFLLIGDDAGLSNARNGSTHQSSLQPLFMQSLPGIRCFEPAVGADLLAAFNEAMNHPGISYLRIHDGKMSGVEEKLLELRSGAAAPADVLLVAAGLMVRPATEAVAVLAAAGIVAHVVDVPDFGSTAPAGLPDVPAVLIYDGHPDVLGLWWSKVDPLTSRPLRSLGFRKGISGSIEELLVWAGLDAESIASAAIELRNSIEFA